MGGYLGVLGGVRITSIGMQKMDLAVCSIHCKLISFNQKAFRSYVGFRILSKRDVLGILPGVSDREGMTQAGLCENPLVSHIDRERRSRPVFGGS